LCTLAGAQEPLPEQVYKFNPAVVHSPVPIQAPDAKMPEQAKQQKLDGLCTLAIVVDRKGIPQEPQIVRCTDTIFAENSLKAVKEYRFVPATTVADSKPVLFSMHVEISFQSQPDSGPVPLPQPKFKLSFLLPPQPAPVGPDAKGIYTLSRDFGPPNSFPKIQRFANVGFGRAAFSLEDGSGCIALLTLDESGHTTNAQIAKCDDPSLENPVLRSLWKSIFSPAVLNGKPVPVHSTIRLTCEGFTP
jgi:hypothetical protein